MELLQLRDLKLRAYMEGYAPKEKNLILPLSLATLMPLSQVEFWMLVFIFRDINEYFLFTVF